MTQHLNVRHPAHEFLPNAFVLGAAKCGTTTLHAYLSELDGVCMSRPKEPFFFECQYARGLDYYRERYFGHWNGEPVIGEARHRNLYLPYVPERIHTTNPDARLIVLVRHPVERAYSHWWHWYARGVERLPFPDAIAADHERIREGLHVATPDERERYCRALGPDGYGLHRTYIDSGYYHRQIQRYLELFAPDQLMVVLLEELSTRPASTVPRVAAFLGAPSGAAAARIEPRYENVRHTRRARALATLSNVRVLRRAFPRAAIALRQRSHRASRPAEIDPDTRAWLVRHYREHNRALGRLLNRDLAHWDR